MRDFLGGGIHAVKKFEAASLEKWIASVLMVVMVISATLGVFYRYVLLDPLSWSEEFVRFSFIWFSYLSTSYVFVHGGNIAMNIIQGLFKDKNHKLLLVLDAVQCLITIGFCLFMSYHGSLFLMKNIRAGELSPGLRMPMWIVLLSVPVCFALMSVRIVQNYFFQHIRRRNDHSDEEGGVF